MKFLTTYRDCQWACKIPADMPFCSTRRLSLRILNLIYLEDELLNVIYYWQTRYCSTGFLVSGRTRFFIGSNRIYAFCLNYNIRYLFINLQVSPNLQYSSRELETLLNLQYSNQNFQKCAANRCFNLQKYKSLPGHMLLSIGLNKAKQTINSRFRCLYCLSPFNRF